MSTAARPISSEGSHWYTIDGKPAYEVPYADPKKGFRPTTLADARKLGLLPSVTTILRILHKQSLVDWLIEQSCLAVLTTPKKEGEDLDAFVHRVLHQEKVQDQESQAARDRGTVIHAALEDLFLGNTVDSELLPWVQPAAEAIRAYGGRYEPELVVIGPGYAGKLDLKLETDNTIWLWDWKTTKKLPERGAWPEHRLQLSAYAYALASIGMPQIGTGNVYISTVEPGKFVVCEHTESWLETYTYGFEPLLKHWQWANNYRPNGKQNAQVHPLLSPLLPQL